MRQPVKSVIDASAMLAFLNREMGHEVVRSKLANALISTVNLAEVLQKIVDRPKEQRMLDAVIANLRIEVVDFDRRYAERVACLYARASKGISFADRACMALGLEQQLPIVTDDHAWEELGLGVELQFFRPKSN